MRAVRSRGNKATEAKLAGAFRQNKIAGWRRQIALVGNPDFVFSKSKLAVFVDGCFWHGCRKHCRMPKGNLSYWKTKIEGNRVRDRYVGRQLRRRGWHVMRVWEHELAKNPQQCVERIREILEGKNFIEEAEAAK
jgi:DNA mismatch endonuclease, patch repair protein